jgi:hypothetical protein
MRFFKNCQVKLHLVCCANCWASILVLGFTFVVKCSYNVFEKFECSYYVYYVVLYCTQISTLVVLKQLLIIVGM